MTYVEVTSPPDWRLQMREKTSEQKLTLMVKAAGGIAPKFVSPGYDGMPDRIVLLPGGRMADDKFYEFLFDAFANTEKAMAQDASIYIFHGARPGAARGNHKRNVCL